MPEREKTARHEAAHAVVAVAGGLTVDYVSIEPDDISLGRARATYNPLDVDEHIDWDILAVSMAGWVADGHLDGSHGDVEWALDHVETYMGITDRAEQMETLVDAYELAEAVLSGMTGEHAAVTAALLEHGRLTGDEVHMLVLGRKAA